MSKTNSYETFFLFIFFFDCLCPTFVFVAKTIVSYFSTWIDLTCVYLSNLRIIFASFDFTHKSLKKWPRNENKWKKYLLQFRYTVRYFFSLVFFSHSSLCIVAVLLVRYLMKRYHNNVYACSTFQLLRMHAKTNARVCVYHRICSVCCAEHTQKETRAIEWDGAVHTVSLDVCIHITLLRWHVLRSRKIVHLQDSDRRYWNQLNFLESFYFMCVMFSLPFSYAHFYFGRKVFLLFLFLDFMRTSAKFKIF